MTQKSTSWLFNTINLENTSQVQLQKIYAKKLENINISHPKSNALFQAKLITTTLTNKEKSLVDSQSWEICRKIKAISEVEKNIE